MNLDRLRFFLSTTLTILFFVTAATVLFFTFGYRFSFERGIFVYTGSITVKSNPRDVIISVDHEPVPEKMRNVINQSIHLTGIAPGEHFLRVEADGFKPWEKKVTVGSGYSTEFWNVLLSRETYAVETLATGPYRKTYPSPKKRYVALSGERGGEAFVEILEEKTGEKEQVFSSRNFGFIDEPFGNIDWSKDENRILVRLTGENGKKAVFLVDRDTKQATNISDFVPLPDPRLVRWHPDRNDILFALSGNTLFLIDMGARNPASRLLLLGESVSTYDLAGNSLYTFESESGIVYRAPMPSGAEFSPDPKTDPLTEATAFKDPVLVVYDEGRFALFERGGRGILYNDDNLKPEIIPLADDTQGALFSNDGKKLLFFSKSEISVAFTRDWEVQPARKSGDVLQIVRFSSLVTSVEWTEDYEHITFILGTDLMLAELDNRDRRQMETILSSPAEPIRNAVPSFEENRIYFFSTGNGESSLRFIRFPEDTGFFGG